MLRLLGGQVESLFDDVLPIEVRELPADLAALDALLSDPAVLEPVERAWDVAARGHGRPTIPIERFVRLMVIKQRTGWGYVTLVSEVSDSLHLRRFCLIAVTERVPDESTIRKLCRRVGPEVIEEICRQMIARVSSSCPALWPRSRSCRERELGVELVAVASAFAGDAEVAGAGELANDGWIAPVPQARSTGARGRLERAPILHRGRAVPLRRRKRYDRSQRWRT